MEWRFYGNKNTAIPNWSNAQVAPKDHKIIIISPVKCMALVMALSAGLWLWSRLYNCTDCHKVLCKGWTLGFFFNPWLLFFCDFQLLYEFLFFLCRFLWISGISFLYLISPVARFCNSLFFSSLTIAVTHLETVCPFKEALSVHNTSKRSMYH